MKTMRQRVDSNNETSLNLLKCCVRNKHFKHLHLKKDEKEDFVTRIAQKLNDGGILQTAFGDFEQLYETVERIIGGENGIGNLMLYDTARMIGYALNPPVVPVRYVYLHCGAKIGAKTLLGLKRVGRKLPITVFSQHFPDEDSQRIEDILCIYKDDLKKGSFTTQSNSRCGRKPIKPRRKCGSC